MSYKPSHLCHFGSVRGFGIWFDRNRIKHMYAIKTKHLNTMDFTIRKITRNLLLNGQEKRQSCNRKSAIRCI